MSRYYDEQSSWYSSTSPEHDRYFRDRHHRSFHPPPLPPIPSLMAGQAAPLPGPGGGFGQGYAAHCDVPTPAEGASFAKNDSKAAARQRRNDDDDDDDDEDDDASSSSFGRSPRPSNFADASQTPSRHRHYHDGPFEHHRVVMPPASARGDEPYRSPRMPSDLAPCWTVASPEHRGGPYFGEAPSLLGVGSGSSESSSASSSSAAAAAAAGGGRPVPAKSAFMCFCEAKGSEISNRNEATPCTQETSGVVEAMAAEWRRLPPREKAYWEGIATNEKTRFAKERDALCKAHKGPLARKLRAKKDPLAPKRPMSAFLMFAQHRRRQLQRENPDVPNSDISRLLGELWRGTGAAEKRPFLEREEAERRMYKAKMEKWKNDQKLERSMKSSSTKEPREMMPDRRQDVSSSAQEETHPRYGPSGQSTNSTAYSTRSALIHHSRQYKEIHTDNEVDISPPRHQYNYDIGSWMPMYNQEEVHLKYTYPRPREDRPQS